MDAAAATTSPDADGITGVPSRPISMSDRLVSLQVCTRHFVTTRETLCSGSTYFEALLSSRWAHNALPDGSFFVDADPDLFEHILRFLRRGVYPVFFDIDKGHDHVLYMALQEEARFFGIDKLLIWLEDKKFLHVVKVQVSLHDMPCEAPEAEADLGRGDVIDIETFCNRSRRTCLFMGDSFVSRRRVTIDTHACLSWQES